MQELQTLLHGSGTNQCLLLRWQPFTMNRTPRLRNPPSLICCRTLPLLNRATTKRCPQTSGQPFRDLMYVWQAGLLPPKQRGCASHISWGSAGRPRGGCGRPGFTRLMAAPNASGTTPRRRLLGGLMMSMLCSIWARGVCATSLRALTQVRHCLTVLYCMQQHSTYLPHCVTVLTYSIGGGCVAWMVCLGSVYDAKQTNTATGLHCQAP